MTTHLILSSSSFRRRPESRKFVPGWLRAPRPFPVGAARHCSPVLFQGHRYFCSVLSFRARRRFSSFRAQALDSFMSCRSDSFSDFVNRLGRFEVSSFTLCEFVDAITKSLLPKLMH